MVESLGEIPYGEMQKWPSKWGQTERFLINTKQKMGLGVKSKNGQGRQVKKTGKKIADELHKTIKRNFTRRRVIAIILMKYGLQIWWKNHQFSKWNKGRRNLLMVTDVLSKYGCIKPLKYKKGETLTEAFKSKEENQSSCRLITDEFYNKHLKELLGRGA